MDTATPTLHRTLDELDAGLEELRLAPASGGALEAIVARPAVEERRELDLARLSPDGGLEGDNWADRRHSRRDDGEIHTDVQLTLMSSRAASLIARDRSRWALAGDQLYVDIDTGEANLPVGQRLRLGGAVIEITAEPHLGCAKFAHRFGNEALRFVNSPAGRELRARGVYARVVEAGAIRVGDVVEKI